MTARFWDLVATPKFQAPPLRSPGSALDPGCTPKHWTLWTPAQDFVKQQDVPVIRTRVPNKYPHQSPGCGSWILLIVKGHLVDTAGHHPALPLRVPKTPHPPSWAVGYPHKGSQATGHSGYPHKTVVEQLDTPVIRTRVYKHLDTPAPLDFGALGPGQLVIPTSALKQLDTLVIRTRLLSSNWTLQLSAQEPASMGNPLPSTAGPTTAVPAQVPSALDTPGALPRQSWS